MSSQRQFTQGSFSSFSPLIPLLQCLFSSSIYLDKGKQTLGEKINEGKSIMVTYDVFLSFRGIDTRKNFTGNLYNCLQHQRGIKTFIDDEKIKKGKQITHTLLQAIKESRIYIAILSPNYASSTFCLTELAGILDCSKLRGRMFLPVFYDVDHVRNITGTYAEAFAKHMEECFAASC
ncbi:unnamed protein product [Trifolium pratense]|uniref:Uncharacterized protein n=1 Tax=Trifolium pratense TaxID=57577 RepID=A0ACB0J4F2_TRIPR|nr:unnamed protein product [Trifolium pratense]